jgi:SAM-dependent methyltransferase
MPGQTYKEQFFESLRDGARESARAVVPIVLQLVRPTSVVDVGCGDGTWLSVFRELGVGDLLGLDGEYVHRGLLQIAGDQFRAVDLTKPLRVERSFDLAVSLEVGEHLPARYASDFVASLTTLAPAVLFSAAIPFQRGIHHVNEQWPDYWAALFNRQDYLPIDCIRTKIWDDDRVEWWYAQNTILFARADLIENDAILRREHESTNRHQLRLVHPRKYLEEGGLREASYCLVAALRRAIRWRVQGLFRGGRLRRGSTSTGAA